MFLIYRYEGHVFTMDLCGLDAHDIWYLLDDFHEAFNDMKLVECRARYPFGEPELVNDLPTPKTAWDKSPKGIHVRAVSATEIKAYHEVQREMALGCLSTPSFEVLSEKRTMNDFIRGVFFRYYMNHMKYWIENEAHIYSVAMDGEVRGGCMVEEINRRALSWRYADLPHGETAVNKLSGVQDMQDFWNADQALKLARTEYEVLKWQRHVNEDRPFWYLTGIHIGQGHWRGSKGLETRLLHHIIGAKGRDSGIFVLCEHDNVELYESEGFIKVDYVQMRSKRVRENTAKRTGDPNRTHLYTTLSGMWRPADHESSRCAVDRGKTPRVFRPEVAALFTGQAGRYI
ncbi:hypothetical protein E8E14_012903 [Neopestalotiopsis sp. 37M]|nr:hypothetical protein E8E14_012903 [Neopestalotiopsis sp. 37M]